MFQHRVRFGFVVSVVGAAALVGAASARAEVYRTGAGTEDVPPWIPIVGNLFGVHEAARVADPVIEVLDDTLDRCTMVIAERPADPAWGEPFTVLDEAPTVLTITGSHYEVSAVGMEFDLEAGTQVFIGVWCSQGVVFKAVTGLSHPGSWADAIGLGLWLLSDDGDWPAGNDSGINTAYQVAGGFDWFLDADGDGWFADEDCDDSHDGHYPGAAPYVCDGWTDDDCDGVVDAIDADHDGDGVTICGGDCEDWDPTLHPGESEVCDGMSNGCMPGVPASEVDLDGDGWMPCDGDCDDGDPSRHPEAEEVCNGIDDDCDGVLDAAESDVDRDGLSACEGDCDDTNPVVRPGAAEGCDGIDSDCDGTLGPPEFDADGDGATPCQGDCNDGVPAVHPGAAEACDGLDNDCDGALDGSEGDADADGARPCGGDCDDQAAGVHPGAAEGCDGIDTDCDGHLDAGEADADGDGVRGCEGDCDDAAAGARPGAAEQCGDGVDNDCDGWADSEDTDCAPGDAPGDDPAAGGDEVEDDAGAGCDTASATDRFKADLADLLAAVAAVFGAGWLRRRFRARN